MKSKKIKTLVTIAQAARAWGMSQNTLRRRVGSGLIETVRSPSPCGGARLFIKKATVDALRAARWCSKEEAEANAEEVW